MTKKNNPIRSILGANLLLIMTFAFLPALLVNPDMDVFQNAMKLITNE
ncbi:hypothetical protein ABZ756_05325 [Mammaliicoccus sciuri]|uniref:Uncharacterized protein n=1 Tax=Sporosarcina newyorkensis TaxID=759851 RepID=A0A1T4YKK6_9BACL|nr:MULTISPECIES: hypothetical protein [Sporosarcina]MBY0223800.1 hypothetical protein [Sporosarcina aquimarina]SKB02286.1 hypothetical protein SAMN04244570_2902 [Sporosarcina newyorkensis]